MLVMSRGDRPYTLAEEIFNTVTHAAGFGLAVAGLAVLVTLAARHASARAVVGCAIFGASLILLYAASALYHGLPWPRAKRVLHHLDHGAIFLLIAGTYTPFTLVCLPPAWGWTIFGLIWGFAALGILFHFTLAKRFPKLALAFYVAMGWLVVIAARPMWQSVPATGLIWLLLGGIAYTLGAMFYGVWTRIPHHHGIFHLWVIVGSVCHFFAVLFSLALIR
jgi:hemolysin III